MSVTTTLTDGLARVVLDQPPLNILTRDMLAGLRAELRRLAAEPTVRMLLLTAPGKHFSAGADVAEHLPPHFHALIPEFVETVAALDAFPAPVMAAVQGRCLGGGFELVLGADVVMAAATARFGQPEIVLGVLPPVACALLPARCPPGAAAAIVFSGEPIDAAEALRLGLVHRVVPDGELESAALALAAQITRHSAAALRMTKRALRGDTGARRAALERAGRLYVDELMRTRDAEEGLRAFLEKRPPAWSHQ